MCFKWLKPKPPAPPVPPPVPPPPDPPPDPPPPPVIPKCDIPYHKTGRLLVVADACLCLVSTKDSETFKMADIPEYLDALVADGVNAIRSVCEFGDETPGKWESWKVSEYGYYDHLRTILNWVKERDLTLILCVQPYGTRTPMPAAHYQGLINQALEYAPNVLVEPENEPQSNEINAIVVNLAQVMGLPNKMIQVEFVDSGEYFDLLSGPLKGEAATCLHFYASMDSITAPWPKGWTTSDGTMRLVREYRLYPSTDGGFDGHDGAFPWWTDPTWHCASPDDAYAMAKWNLGEGGRGIELLSRSMFATDFPNVRLSIEGGREERRLMRRAYNEVVV
jgi:hypothetical protein